MTAEVAASKNSSCLSVILFTFYGNTKTIALRATVKDFKGAGRGMPNTWRAFDPETPFDQICHLG